MLQVLIFENVLAQPGFLDEAINERSFEKFSER